VTESGAGSLADAVQAGLSGAGLPSLTAGVRRLMAAYRSGEVPDAPVMASAADAAAYAAYRMPATVAATAAALRQLRLALPQWAPRTLLDFGAGTGGTAWAVVDELPSIGQVTLLEQSANALRLGRAILAESDADALRSATWRPWRLGPADRQPQLAPAADARAADAGATDAGADDQRAAALPAADLATAGYVLGELTERQQAVLLDLAMQAAPAVLLVEPGTPAGHNRILAARASLLARGYQVAAPCPHELGCPLAAADDWCHFGARVQRSAVHRQAKGAELSYEDEKFSYVAAVRPGGPPPAAPPRCPRRAQAATAQGPGLPRSVPGRRDEPPRAGEQEQG
jgi:ribosomal protein RSM22 (predicted rRNA methylase)